MSLTVHADCCHRQVPLRFALKSLKYLNGEEKERGYDDDDDDDDNNNNNNDDDDDDG